MNTEVGAVPLQIVARTGMPSPPVPSVQALAMHPVRRIPGLGPPGRGDRS